LFLQILKTQSFNKKGKAKKLAFPFLFQINKFIFFEIFPAIADIECFVAFSDFIGQKTACHIKN
jgi:hypothetical protein